jgi:hypothetical protein
MAISLQFSEGEDLSLRGWVAKFCVKCRCIHAFSIHEIIERSSVSLGFVPLSSSSRRTNSCIAQCDFCGTIVRQKPKVVSTSWGPAQGMAPLIAETMPGATPDQAPTSDLGGVIAVLALEIQAHKRRLTSLRQSLTLMATVYIILVCIGVSRFVAPPNKFAEDTTLLLTMGGCLLIPIPVAYLLVRLFNGWRYRKHCDKSTTVRLRHLEDRYGIAKSDLDRAREELAKVR